MVGVHIDVGEHVFIIEDHAGDFGGAKGAGDEEHRVGSPIDDVDILVAQFADDAVDTGAFHADAGADGIDTVVVRLNGDLGALTRFTDDLLNGDQAVEDLGDLGFEQTLQKHL